MFLPDTGFLEESIIFFERMQSWILLVQTRIDYVRERVDVTNWLIRRGRRQTKPADKEAVNSAAEEA